MPRWKPPLSPDELREILTLALWAGSIVMENGGNAIRAEETVHRLGTALGAEWMDVLVTPSGIIATDLSAGEHRTKVRRIVNTNVELSRLAEVSDLVRAAVEGIVDGEAVRHSLEAISLRPREFDNRLTTVSVALACASFAILFGGGIIEFIVTLLATAFSQALRAWLLRRRLSRPMTTGLIAALGSTLAYLIARVLVAPRPDLAMLSTVLALVPGALLVSSITDLITGELLSAIARLANVIVLTTAIGAGVWVALLLTGARLR